MSEPLPLPPIPLPTPRPAHNGRRYLLGLGLGFIPVLLVCLSGVFSSYVLNNYGASGPNDPGLSSFLLTAGGILYLVELIGMIVCLADKGIRFVGYGLLTMVLIGPVVAV